MCRNRFVFVLLLSSCFFLSACRVVFDPFAQNAEQKEVQKEHRQKANVQEQEEVVQEEAVEPAFKIDASLTLDGENMVISGETDLPAESFLQIRLIPYKGNATVEDIKEETAGTLNEVPANTVGIGASVGEGGVIEAKTFNRPDLSTRYRFELTFEPAGQEEEIKQQLIEQAGNLDELAGLQVIKEADGENSMTHGDESVKGYIQTVNIMKAEEKDGDGVTLEFE